MYKEVSDILNDLKIGVLKVAKLSKETGIPASRMYKWKDRGSKITSQDADILKEWILKLDNSPRETYVQTRQELKTNGKKSGIPFYDAPATASLTETEMTAIHAPSGTIDIGDLLNDSQAAIRIYGNSMLPNYPPGCVVGLAKCTTAFIEPGEVYVIETRDRRLLKRLFYKNDESEGDFISCYSDNIMKFEGGSRHGKLAYPPFDIPKSEIINLFVVTGVIKRNANSIIINR